MERKVGVGIIGSQFICVHPRRVAAHLAQAELVGVASPAPIAPARSRRSSASRTTSPITGSCWPCRRWTWSWSGAPNDLHCADHARRRGGGQARRLREAAVPEPGRGRPDDRRLPQGGREADVRRGAVLRAQVRPAQAAARRAARWASRPWSSSPRSTTARTPPQFWDVERSGGGVTMDMGCHAIEFFRWMLGPAARSSRVYAQMGTYVHGDKTRGDDNAILILEFEDGAVGARRGKLDEARRHGRPRRGPRLEGRRLRRPAPRQRDRDLQRRAATTTRWRRPASTAAGASRCTRRSGTTASRRRWPTSSTASQNDKQPLVTGEDGRAVLEVIFAAYASARDAGRR